MAKLVVVGQRETGEAYLARWLGAYPQGHGAEILPVSRILRMLRYPDQGALLWPEVACEFDPLPARAVVRLPVIRETLMSDLAALDWFRDYAASVRFYALEAQGRARTETQRMVIALQLAGRRRRKRSVYVLDEWEVLELGLDLAEEDAQAGGVAAAEPLEDAGRGGAAAARGAVGRDQPGGDAGARGRRAEQPAGRPDGARGGQDHQGPGARRGG